MSTKKTLIPGKKFLLSLSDIDYLEAVLERDEKEGWSKAKALLDRLKVTPLIKFKRGDYMKGMPINPNLKAARDAYLKTQAKLKAIRLEREERLNLLERERTEQDALNREVPQGFEPA